MKLLVPTIMLAVLLSHSAEAAKYNLKPTAPDDLTYAVEVELKVGGDLSVREPTAAKEASGDPAVRKLPMSVVGNLAYEEKRLGDHTIARYYETAHATIKVGEGGKAPRLPRAARLIVARSTDAGLALSAQHGALTREQLDLIEVIGATPYLDSLLPDKELAEGEAWQVSADAMQLLLGLDSVSVCEVSNVIDEGNAGHVKFQVAGTVHGTVEGAETEFDIRGVGLFGRKHGCVTRLNLAVKENRSVGPATPGFSGVAKVNIARKPIKAPEELTADRLALVRSNRESSTGLLLDAPEQGFRVLHSRDWYQAAESPTTVSLRRIEQGALVAQATFSRIRSKSTKQQPTLAEFESEIKQGIGPSLTELISHDEWTNISGAKCLCVVARGKVEDLELEYRHYLILPAEGGRSVSLAVTLAVDDLAALGAADRELADAVVLTQKQPEVAEGSRAVK